MKRRFAALMCAFSLCAAMVVPVSAATFADVPPGAWYEPAVNEMVENGIMTGVAEGVFAPLGNVTRGALVTALWRMEGEPQAAAKGHFPDVAPDAWYGDAVDWAYEVGIIKGTDKGLFNGSGVLSRQELAVILTRYDSFRGTTALAQGSLEQFLDADEAASWAKEGLAHAVGMGWLEGSDDKLSPKGATNRAQLAVILQRLTIEAAG